MAAAVLGGASDTLMSKKQVEAILPHRGDKLFLDEVTITEDLLIGRFLVTEAVCAGHGVLENGQTVFKGSDYCDMAAQLLGIYVSQVGSLPTKKGCVVVRYDGVELLRMTRPGELLTMEVVVEDLEVVVLERKAGKTIAYLTGMNFVARAGGKDRATILLVEAVAI